jgi:hypothetical protein
MILRNKIKYFLSIAGVFLLLLMIGCSFSGEDKKEAESENEISADPFGGDPDFELLEHHFGTIAPGEEVGARFGFKNSGDELLLIERVITGCGCTVAQYTEKPLKPGESGFVEIIFDSRGKRGSQFQEARVFFRGHKKPALLSIFAEVVKKLLYCALHF